MPLNKSALRKLSLPKASQQTQTHVHEFNSSTKLAEPNADRHNHRFAGVTGQAIRRGKSHVHRIVTNTDFFGHFHRVVMETGPAIPLGNGKHVHVVRGMTTLVDGHRHQFNFATLVESPLLPNTPNA